ncbi:hypothetical protein RFI_33006 [Reticulomyxa filosa]|uniref:Uncharacterized protein n=1 Tax=Reticulomyxa filosa TaxID=46433 RepID=X6LSR5_RETFI|nr:hypothetical protein RFI_33006 [Reticulomyxa filosa]|eukprot:ETO04391.1 hypothetical protein RFI_33006 [Reticulomyxa filosa]
MLKKKNRNKRTIKRTTFNFNSKYKKRFKVMDSIKKYNNKKVPFFLFFYLSSFFLFAVYFENKKQMVVFSCAASLIFFCYLFAGLLSSFLMVFDLCPKKLFDFLRFVGLQYYVSIHIYLIFRQYLTVVRIDSCLANYTQSSPNILTKILHIMQSLRNQQFHWLFLQKEVFIVQNFNEYISFVENTFISKKKSNCSECKHKQCYCFNSITLITDLSGIFVAFLYSK